MINDCMKTTSRRALISIIFVEIIVIGLFLHTKTHLLESGPTSPKRVAEKPRRTQPHHHRVVGGKGDEYVRNNVPSISDWNSTTASVKYNMTTVAIGCAITSHKIPDVLDTTLQNIHAKFIFFTALLPTFCITASPGYSYHFYLAYDKNDKFFSKYSFLAMFQTAFYRLADERCTDVTSLTLHFVQCNHDRKPAWAQNDAMMEAYIDNIDYYYRINDDTLMRTRNWTTHFISTLASFDPPNLGVVGPTHKGGNKKILTYDFVHRSHVDLYGFYYPRVFTDWFADGWITAVYKPGRSVKLKTVELRHTMKLGQRYGQHSSRKAFKPRELDRDKEVLQRYIELSRKRTSVEHKFPSGKKVIATALVGGKRNDIFGAIRNAMLVKLFYPGWTYRIYTGNSSKSTPQIPKRILNKLLALGVEIIYLNSEFTTLVPVRLWKYLVVDTDVQVFLLRDVQHRIDTREAEAVQDWLTANQPAATHCMRDHPSQAAQPIIDSLWGGFPDKLFAYLKKSMEETIVSYVSSFMQKHGHNSVAIISEGQDRRTEIAAYDDMLVSGFLTEVIYPAVRGDIHCHDSISCDKWPNSKPFFQERNKNEYIGRKVDAFDTLVESLVPPPLNVTTSVKCRPVLIRS